MPEAQTAAQPISKSSHLEREVFSSGLEGIVNGFKIGLDPLGAVYAKEEEQDKYIIGGQGLYDNYKQGKHTNYASKTYKFSKFLGFLGSAALNIATFGVPIFLSTMYDYAAKPKKKKE